MNGRTVAGAAAHLVLGALLSSPFFLLGWDIWNSWGMLDADTIDTEIWWWWAPFCSMELLAALLTIRPPDRRLFWRLLFVLWVSFAGAAMLLSLVAN